MKHGLELEPSALVYAGTRSLSNKETIDLSIAVSLKRIADMLDKRVPTEKPRHSV